MPRLYLKTIAILYQLLPPNITTTLDNSSRYLETWKHKTHEFNNEEDTCNVCFPPK